MPSGWTESRQAGNQDVLRVGGFLGLDRALGRRGQAGSDRARSRASTSGSSWCPGGSRNVSSRAWQITRLAGPPLSRGPAAPPTAPRPRRFPDASPTLPDSPSPSSSCDCAVPMGRCPAEPTIADLQRSDVPVQQANHTEALDQPGQRHDPRRSGQRPVRRAEAQPFPTTYSAQRQGASPARRRSLRQSVLLLAGQALSSSPTPVSRALPANLVLNCFMEDSWIRISIRCVMVQRRRDSRSIMVVSSAGDEKGLIWLRGVAGSVHAESSHANERQK